MLMTENKRYTVDTFIADYPCGFKDLEDNECEVFCDKHRMTYKEVVNTLNRLHEENNEFKINEEFKNKAYSDLLDNFTQLKKK